MVGKLKSRKAEPVEARPEDDETMKPYYDAIKVFEGRDFKTERTKIRKQVDDLSNMN